MIAVATVVLAVAVAALFGRLVLMALRREDDET